MTDLKSFRENDPLRRGDSWRARFYRAKDKLLYRDGAFKTAWQSSSEAISEIQENARFANEVIEELNQDPDNQLAAERGLELIHKFARILQKNGLQISEEEILSIQL